MGKVEVPYWSNLRYQTKSLLVPSCLKIMGNLRCSVSFFRNHLLKHQCVPWVLVSSLWSQQTTSNVLQLLLWLLYVSVLMLFKQNLGSHKMLGNSCAWNMSALLSWYEDYELTHWNNHTYDIDILFSFLYIIVCTIFFYTNTKPKTVNPTSLHTFPPRFRGFIETEAYYLMQIDKFGRRFYHRGELGIKLQQPKNPDAQCIVYLPTFG